MLHHRVIVLCNSACPAVSSRVDSNAVPIRFDVRVALLKSSMPEIPTFSASLSGFSLRLRAYGSMMRWLETLFCCETAVQPPLPRLGPEARDRTLPALQHRLCGADD